MANDKPKTILERVTDLEVNLRGLASNFSRIDQLNQGLADIVDVLQATLAELNATSEGFEGKVELRVQAKRDEQRKQRDARAAEAVSRMAADGTLVPTDTVSDQAFVVGRLFNPDGVVISERVQGVLGVFPEQLRSQMLGKGAGESVKDTDGSTFELLEVYLFGTPKPVTEAVSAPTDEPSTTPTADSTSAT